MEPLWISLRPPLLSTLIAWILAVAAARVRFSVPRGFRWALDIIFLLPLALPSALIFTLASLYALYVGSDGIVVGDSFSALPVYYLCALMGFRRIKREWVDAARLQGLGHCGIFWRVWFPAAWPWLAAGLAVGIVRVAILVAMLHA